MRAFRILIACAGLMGASGVALAAMAAHHQAVAAAALERRLGAEAPEIAGIAITQQVFAFAHAPSPRYSRMWWSYSSWPRSVLRSSRSSLITLML